MISGEELAVRLRRSIIAGRPHKVPPGKIKGQRKMHPMKRQVKDKTEEPDVPKETEVPELEHEVQLVESVGVELDVVPGLEWDDTEPEVYEDPKPAKDDVDQPPVDDKASEKSEVPRVLWRPNSKSTDEQKKKWMVSAFKGGEKRAKEREDDPKKAAELSGPKFFATDDCPEKFVGKMPEEIVEYKKVLHKQKLNTVAW